MRAETLPCNSGMYNNLWLKICSNSMAYRSVHQFRVVQFVHIQVVYMSFGCYFVFYRLAHSVVAIHENHSGVGRTFPGVVPCTYKLLNLGWVTGCPGRSNLQNSGLQQRNHNPPRLSDHQRYQPTPCRSITDMDGCVDVGFRAGLGLGFQCYV